MDMTFTVDPRHPLPLHAQVERLLRQLIAEPAYRAGATLPDEVGMAKRLGISRNTVRSAIERLVREGLVERRRGVGTRVVRAPAAVHDAAWDAFLGELEPRGAGIAVAAATAELATLPPDEARALGCDSGSAALRVERTLADGDGTLGLIRSWFHPRVPLAARDDFRLPLWERIERELGVIPTVAQEEVAAVVADAALARQLACARGLALLKRRRVVCDAQARPLEVATAWYRGDRCRRAIELRRV